MSQKLIKEKIHTHTLPPVSVARLYETGPWGKKGRSPVHVCWGVRWLWGADGLLGRASVSLSTEIWVLQLWQHLESSFIFLESHSEQLNLITKQLF